VVLKRVAIELDYDASVERSVRRGGCHAVNMQEFEEGSIDRVECQIVKRGSS
jgi:hypothetical protein